MAAIDLFATGLPLLSSVLQTATGMGGGVGERCPGNRLASGIPAGASIPRDNLGPAPKPALKRIRLLFRAKKNPFADVVGK